VVLEEQEAVAVALEMECQLELKVVYQTLVVEVEVVQARPV
jgi:hypothetical protein